MTSSPVKASTMITVTLCLLQLISPCHGVPKHTTVVKRHAMDIDHTGTQAQQSVMRREQDEISSLEVSGNAHLEDVSSKEGLMPNSTLHMHSGKTGKGREGKGACDACTDPSDATTSSCGCLEEVQAKCPPTGYRMGKEDLQAKNEKCDGQILKTLTDATDKEKCQEACMLNSDCGAVFRITDQNPKCILYKKCNNFEPSAYVGKISFKKADQDWTCLKTAFCAMDKVAQSWKSKNCDAGDSTGCESLVERSAHEDIGGVASLDESLSGKRGNGNANLICAKEPVFACGCAPKPCECTSPSQGKTYFSKYCGDSCIPGWSSCLSC